MREYASEVKAARSGKTGASDESAVLALIRSVAPDLAPRTWYGMPAYAKDGSVLCFFQDARKFKTRYCTLGFTDKAALDDGELWPVAFALKKLTPAVEARITELLKNAIR